MSASKPAVLFIHGAYHPPEVYEPLTSKIRAAGFDLAAPRLASLGQSPHATTIDEDIAAIRAGAQDFFNADRPVVVVAHSVGGFLSTIAIKDRTVADRKARGDKGGFAGIVYIAATLTSDYEENVIAVCSPDCAVRFNVDVRDDGKMASYVLLEGENKEHALDLFYNNAPRDMAEAILPHLARERFTTNTFLTPATVLAKDLDIPKAYVIAGKDHLVIVERQEQVVAETPGMKAVRLSDAGHSPFLSHPGRIVEAVVEMAAQL